MSQMHEFWVKEQGNNIMHSTNIIIAHQHLNHNQKSTQRSPTSCRPAANQTKSQKMQKNP